jgi:hypothetical protein
VRRMHFVGSYPAPSAGAAMRAMIEGTDRTLDLVPDGETGSRSYGMRDELIALKEQHPAIVVSDPGKSFGLRRSPWLEVRPGREAQLTATSLAGLAAFDYLGQAIEARATLDGLEGTYGREFSLQQGLPHFVDVAFLAFSPDFGELTGDVPHGRVFSEHLRRQIHATIAEIGADRVVFQLESPHALIDSLRYAVAATSKAQQLMIGETVAEVINRASPQARFGVHLCLGDACDGPVVPTLPTTAPIVAAVEAIGIALERPEALEYVHFPLASGPNPPVLEPGLYRPLAALRGVLPEETQIIAGLVHERQPLSEQLRVLDLVESAIGEPVGVAASCGLARRTPGVAVHVMRRMIELASA